MPTILREQGYEFFFYSNERKEPAHIHVWGQRGTAKFWLKPVSLASSRGLRSHDLSELQRIVVRERDLFEEKWHEHASRKV